MVFKLDNTDERMPKIVVSRSHDKVVIGFFVLGIENKIWFHPLSPLCFTEDNVESLHEWFEKATNMLSKPIILDVFARNKLLTLV